MKAWSNEEVILLKTLRLQGTTYKTIGELLDRSIKSVEGKCNRENIVNPKWKEWTESEICILIEKINKGYSYLEISSHLDRNANSIKQKAFKLNIQYKYKQAWSTAEEEKLKYALEIDELTYYEASSVFKRSPEALKTKACSIGIEYTYSGSFDVNKDGQTYLIYFEKYDLYKIGVSNNYTSRIYNFGTEPTIILVLHFKNGKDALKLEKLWLKNIEYLKINTSKLNSGNTETFRYDIIGE